MKTLLTKTIAAFSLSAMTFPIVAPQSTLAQAKAKNAQKVTVTVDNNGYHPAAIKLKAGKPVHMTFVSKGDGCANAVSIPALNKSFNLKPGQKKQVVFTPRKNQTVVFACSMNMFKGRAVTR